MTYSMLLLRFVAIPVAGLACLVLRDWHLRKRAGTLRWRGWSPYALLLVLLIVAILYTAPWDHHLIAIGVWWYRPALVSGISFGRIPLEEMLFFPLQTLLIGLWCLWLIPRVASRSGRAAGPRPGWRADGDRHHAWQSKKSRLILALTSAGVWLIALDVLRAGWRPGTYLGWELIWALPPLILQVGLGGDILWHYRQLLCIALAPSVLYLSVVDTLAIRMGIWTIDPHQTLGILLDGHLPLEELLFFALTSGLVACALVLGTSTEFRERLRRYRVFRVYRALPLFGRLSAGAPGTRQPQRTR